MAPSRIEPKVPLLTSRKVGQVSQLRDLSYPRGLLRSILSDSEDDTYQELKKYF